MERVTTRQAASELEMDLDTLQFLMRENRLPIGHAIKKEGMVVDMTLKTFLQLHEGGVACVSIQQMPYDYENVVIQRPALRTKNKKLLKREQKNSTAYSLARTDAISTISNDEF